jgi:hypothetical protein
LIQETLEVGVVYIRQLTVQKIKLIRDMTLRFLRGDQPRMWTVLLGENGLCKTTLLQAIALAASGVDRANQLAEVGSLPDRRLPKPEVFLRAEFSFGEGYHEARTYPGWRGRPASSVQLISELHLPPGWSVFQGTSSYGDAVDGAENGDPLREARAQSLPYWFVAGYGVQRMLSASHLLSDQADAVRERLETLFGKGQIIGTSFADLFTKTPLVQAFTKQLQQALVQEPPLLPRVTGLELRGRGGVRRASDLIEAKRFSFQAGDEAVKVPAVWLSQGYQGMIAWVADLIGQQFWEADSDVELADMEGLILIDELDLFVHPAWQVHVVSRLKKTFPRMQFVVTTHSPMLLSGCERDEVVILQQDSSGNVEAHEAPASPALMSGSELYKVFFGVEGLYPNLAGALLRQYGFLASNPDRSDEEDAEVRRIRDQLISLGVTPDWEPVARR